MSSKRKITLILVGSISLMLLLFGSSVYYFQSNYSYVDFYKRLATRVSVAEKYYLEKNDVNSQSLKRLRDEHLEKLNDEREYIELCKSPSDLERIANEKLLPIDFLKTVYSNTSASYQKNNVFYYGMRYNKATGTYLVIVSAKNYYSTHHLILLRNVLIGSGLVSIFIIIYLSYFFSKRIFDPINQIINKVNSISTDNIHIRLDELKDNSEITKLASTFNSLLSRIEIAFETNKNFISNASHEFNTPLTSIIGEADVALLKDRAPNEYKDTLQKILEQAERLNTISQSLLFLAQTGYKENRLSFNILRTDELILQSKVIMDQLIPHNNIQIDFNLLPENPMKLKVSGNKELLILAFTNILTNACKYSSNKPVLISLASTNNEVVMVFKDQGIGIPESEIQYIYDPFFRASNTGAYDGYGIGLPLTRNIIRIHGGVLNISSVQQQGVTVQVKLPIAKLL
ncbi:MAG: HAMP domain-containing sensor histidine kinase [Bacteroidota bacterium]